VGTTDVKYVHDGDRVIEERDGSGNTQAQYIYGVGIDEIVRMERASSRYYTHRDGLGSAVTLTDAVGGKVESYAYDPFGEPSLFDKSGNKLDKSIVGNSFLFSGRDYENEAKLYNMRSRWYRPDIGRFLSPDPIGFASGDLNLYRYVFNDPLTYTDPYGENPLLWVLGVAILAVIGNYHGYNVEKERVLNSYPGYVEISPGRYIPMREHPHVIEIAEQAGRMGGITGTIIGGASAVVMSVGGFWWFVVGNTVYSVGMQTAVEGKSVRCLDTWKHAGQDVVVGILVMGCLKAVAIPIAGAVASADLMNGLRIGAGNAAKAGDWNAVRRFLEAIKNSPGGQAALSEMRDMANGLFSTGRLSHPEATAVQRLLNELNIFLGQAG
jgi:RHS repeat-associated protein